MISCTDNHYLNFHKDYSRRISLIGGIGSKNHMFNHVSENEIQGYICQQKKAVRPEDWE